MDRREYIASLSLSGKCPKIRGFENAFLKGYGSKWKKHHAFYTSEIKYYSISVHK
jgi:hypothetical protein